MNYTLLYIRDISEAASTIPCRETLRGKKIFITGANGLICCAIVDMLMTINDEDHAGISIFIATRNMSKTIQRFGKRCEREDITLVNYDATQPFHADIKPDYIIHGASAADPKAIMEHPTATIKSNIQGLSILLDIATKQNSRLLYISSSEIYGIKEGGEPLSENDYGYIDILNPRSCYPSAKRTAETMCVSYTKEYATDTVIVRPGHIYGPTMTDSDSRASSQFPRDLIAGKDIVMKSEGLQQRSYCYVADCASAILSVLIKGERGEAYNISNKNSIVSIRQMAEYFAQAAHKQVVFSTASKSEKTSFNMMSNSSLTSSKIESLGWRALTDMPTGAEHTLNILRNSQ